MKLSSLLILLALVSIVAAKVKTIKESDEGFGELEHTDYDDDYEEMNKEINTRISKKKQSVNERRKDKSADTEDSKEIPTPAPNKNKAAEDKPTVICDGMEGQACSCEMQEVNCVNVVFDDDGILDTLDLALSTENPKLEKFKPITARFADNQISKLERNRMPEGMEEDLAALHLERNRIVSIEAHAFDGFKNISKLGLERNWLRQIRSDMFEGDIAKTLHVLDLGHNRLTNITEKKPFRKLKNLRKLILDGNPLVLDEDLFEGLGNLETLSLDDCNLVNKKLPKGLFKPLTKLKSLSLRGNKFNEVPDVLEDIPHLQYLDLSETRIAELHRQSFVGEPEMRSILFEYMPFLASIQECAFCGLNQLQTLTFRNSTALSYIDENAFGFKEYTDDRTAKLVDLNLRNCNITKLPQYMLEYDTLESLELSNVPLNCTCEVMYLKNMKLPSGYSLNARCAYPAAMKGKYLDQATIKELCGSRYARGYRFFFALFGVICAAIIATVGYILFNKGYRFTNIRHLPMPSLPGANSAYTNLSRQEENELTDSPTGPSDNTPDFQPRPQMV